MISDWKKLPAFAVWFVVVGLPVPVLAIDSLHADSIKFVVHISVDGLRPDAVTTLGPDQAPNFYRLRNEGAFTDNARTDIDFTQTLPNHASMLTGRFVLGSDGHGVQFNSTNASTFEVVHGAYVAGVFDVAHDNGLRTGLFYSKDKFEFYSRSWNSANGAEDVVGIDNGKAKIDRVLFKDDTASLTSNWIKDMKSDPYHYSFIHYRDPDTFGHDRRWMSEEYLNSVVTIDEYIGQIMELVESDSALVGRTVIVLTSDHGGSANNHSVAGEPLHFTIPVYIWGPGVHSGADLYQLNWESRQIYCRNEPGITALVAPIRNGGSGNLALSLLGLPAIPGSQINNAQDLALRLPDGVILPEVALQSPILNQRFLTGEPISFEADTETGTSEIAKVVFELGCDVAGTDVEAPFVLDWSIGPPGLHTARATAFDIDGRFTSDTVSVRIDASLSVNGSVTDWLALGIDPVVNTARFQTDPELVLSRFFFYEDDLNFYFAFDAGASAKRVAYGVYLDLDAARGNQMTDPLGHAVRGSRSHSPEVIFYFVHDAQDGWTNESPSFFLRDYETDLWQAVGWPPEFDFSANENNGFVEFSVPKNVLTDYPGSQGIFAELFTVGETEGAGASDSIPSETGISYTTENTFIEETVLSIFHNFTFPDFLAETIVIDGDRFDWLRSTITPVQNSTGLQTDPELALDRLFITHDLDNYYFAFLTRPGSKNVSFGFYIDSGTHEEPSRGSGGAGDANGNAIETVNFLPDVQIYFENDGTEQWTSDTPRYYVWNNSISTWAPVSSGNPMLPTGSSFATGLFGGTSFVEFSIPRDAPGLYDTETLNVELFSVGGTPGAGASSTIPSDPNIMFTTENFSTDVTVLSSPHRYLTQPVIVQTEHFVVLPAGLQLFQNFPNPVYGTTTISFVVNRSQDVRLLIYDLLGRLKSVLFDTRSVSGTQTVVLDTSGFASGIYLLRLDGDRISATKKMIVVR